MHPNTISTKYKTFLYTLPTRSTKPNKLSSPTYSLHHIGHQVFVKKVERTHPESNWNRENHVSALLNAFLGDVTTIDKKTTTSSDNLCFSYSRTAEASCKINRKTLLPGENSNTE